MKKKKGFFSEIVQLNWCSVVSVVIFTFREVEHQWRSVTRMPRARRVVMVPYPLQGHINPMLQLATILHSRGFSITVVHPRFNSPNPSSYPDFAFVPIPDGLPKGSFATGDFTSPMLNLNGNCEEPVRRCIEQMLEFDDSEDRVSCVIYDWVMYSVQKVASEFGLLSFSVRTSAAASMLAFAAFPRDDGRGCISFQDSLSLNESTELQSFQSEGLLDSMSKNPSDTVLELRACTTTAMRNSSAIIVNTIHFLEEEMLTKVQEYFPLPIFELGPFHKLAPSSSSSLLEEDTSCISWLEKQAPRSVLYVSFGSMASLSEEQLLETAMGLSMSKQPFLWVVRPGSVRGSDWLELLPKELEESLRHTGCIVRWAPQKEVLANGAVGGFWTHCGWNSTLESICEGVPMLCWPVFADQGLDAKYISRKWKTGFELETELERGKIATAIRRLMVDEEGQDMSKRAMAFEEKAERSLRKGGSTYESLNALVQLLLLSQSQQKSSS